MSPLIASTIFAIGIAGLFYLDRGEKSRVSKALWIPTAWLFLCLSRSVSAWLGAPPPVGDGGVYLDGSPVDRAVFLLLEFAAMFAVIARWRRVSPILRRNWVIGLFFLYAAMSISWSDYSFVAFKHWIKAIGDVLMVLIILTEPSVVDAFKRIVTRLGFVLLPLSILFIRYYPDLGRRFNNSFEIEPIGVSEQKNGLGILCYIIGLGLLWRFRSAYNDREDPKRRGRLLAIGTVLCMAVYLLWTCNSLTSICALSMGSAAMLVSNRPIFRRNRALVHSLTAAMIGTAIYALFFQSSGGLVESLGRDATLSGRSTGWRIILSIPCNHIVGAGYETFWLGPRLQMVWDAFPGMKIGQAHSGYIEMILNLGWVGLALLALLFANGYRNAVGAYRLNPDIGSLKIAYLIAVIINGLTEGIFRMMTPPWIFFLLVTAFARWDAPASVRRRVCEPSLLKQPVQALSADTLASALDQ